MLGRRDARERAHHFVGPEHDREPPRFLRRGDQIVKRPGLLEGDLIEEPERADRDLGRTGFLGVAPEPGRPDRCESLSGPKSAGDRPKYRANRATLDIGALCARRQIPNLHVLERALPKRGHRRFLCSRTRARLPRWQSAHVVAPARSCTPPRCLTERSWWASRSRLKRKVPI